MCPDVIVQYYSNLCYDSSHRHMLVDGPTFLSWRTAPSTPAISTSVRQSGFSFADGGNGTGRVVYLDRVLAWVEAPVP